MFMYNCISLHTTAIQSTWLAGRRTHDGICQWYSGINCDNDFIGPVPISSEANANAKDDVQDSSAGFHHMISCLLAD